MEIINDCFSGFGIHQEVFDELESDGFSEEELRAAARLIEEIENSRKREKKTFPYV